MNQNRIYRKAREGSPELPNLSAILLPILFCFVFLIGSLGASGSEGGPLRPALPVKKKPAPKKLKVQAPTPVGNLQLEAERPLLVPPEAAAELEAAKAAAKLEAVKAAAGQAKTVVDPKEAATQRILEKASAVKLEAHEKTATAKQQAADKASSKAEAAVRAAEAQLRVPEVEIQTPTIQLSVPGGPKVEAPVPVPVQTKATGQLPAATQPGTGLPSEVPSAVGPSAGQPSAASTELKAKTVTPEKSLFFIPVEKEAPAPTPAQQENKQEKTVKGKDKGRGDVAEFQKSISKEYEGLSKDELVEIINNQLYRTSLVIQQLRELKKRQSEKGASVSLGGGSPVDSRIKEAQALATKVNPSIYEAFPGDSPESAIERADMLFRLGQFSMALQQYYVVRDHPDMKKRLDEAAQSWALFQIGNCEMLLDRLKSAQSRWDEVNSYFEDSGALPTAHIENKFRDFFEDNQAVQHWSTGFWRRQSETELTQFKLKEELQKANEASKAITASLRQRANTYIPKQSHLLLKKD